MLAAAHAASPGGCSRNESTRVVSSCARLWPSRSSAPLSVVSVLNYKATAAAALVNWADYHLLLGLEHMVFVDNNCGAAAAAAPEAALRPYVDAGVATLVTEYRCLAFNASFGAPLLRYHALARAAAAPPLRNRLRFNTLVLAIDDDEYVVLPNPRETLVTVATSLRTAQVCVANLLWRNYGDAGFACQPQTAAASSFMRRAPLWQEASSAQHHHFVEEAIRAADATALGGPGFRKGKIVFYWSQMRPCVMSAVRRQRHSNKTEVRPLGHECQASCLGGTHFTNCANLRHARLPTATKLFSDAPARRFLHANGRLPPTMVADQMCHSFSGASGDPIASGLASGGVWINHYQFQSLEHWEAKKARGRTNMNRKRKGSPPPYFNAVEDAAGALALQLRIGAVASAPLRDCLARQFSLLPGSPAAEEARLARPPPSANAIEHDRRAWRRIALGRKRSVNQYQQPRRLRGVLFLHFSGSAGSSLFDWLTRTLGLRKHPNASINGNWGPDARIPGHQHIANGGAAGGVTPRHSCGYAEAEIRRPGGSNVFGHETPALAPLRCATAAIWLVLRQPVERLLSRLYKPREKRCAHGPAAYRRRYCGESMLRIAQFGGAAGLLGAFASNLTGQNQMKFDAKEVGRDSRAGTGEFLGAISLNEPYTRALLGPEAVLRPLGSVSEADLVAAKAVLDSLDVVMPMWAMEMAPFALGLPAHVLGPAYRITRSHSTASAGEVTPALIAELERRNRLDVRLYAHATHMHRARVGRAAQQLWPPPPPSPSPAPTTAPSRGATALELCPAADFADALHSLSPLVPGAVSRSGGLGALTARYVSKFGAAVCPAAGAAVGWPPSNRSRRLLFNMAEGTSGTRMVDCMLTKRGMRTAHFPQTATALTPRRNATGPLHACTRGAGNRSCTGEYDAYDFASDVPVPQVAQLLLETHTAAQVAAVLTLRDPWGWAMSRVNGHSQSNKSESLRLTDDFSYVSVPCGCAWRPADRAPLEHATVERRYGADPDTARRMAARATLDGDSGVLLDTYTAPGCAPPTPLARHTAAALDLLTHNAWTFCVARRRRVPLFAANLAEDMFLTQGVPGRDDARPLLSTQPHARLDSLFDAFTAFVDATTGRASALASGREEEQWCKDHNVQSKVFKRRVAPSVAAARAELKARKEKQVPSPPPPPPPPGPIDAESAAAVAAAEARAAAAKVRAQAAEAEAAEAEAVAAEVKRRWQRRGRARGSQEASESRRRSVRRASGFFG